MVWPSHTPKPSWFLSCLDKIERKSFQLCMLEIGIILIYDTMYAGADREKIVIFAIYDQALMTTPKFLFCNAEKALNLNRKIGQGHPILGTLQCCNNSNVIET